MYTDAIAYGRYSHASPGQVGTQIGHGAGDAREFDPTGRQVGLHALARFEGPVVLLADHFESFGLMDTWLRQVLVPALHDNVRVLFFGREAPVAAWHLSPERG